MEREHNLPRGRSWDGLEKVVIFVTCVWFVYNRSSKRSTENKLSVRIRLTLWFYRKDDSFPIIKQIFTGSDGKHRALPNLIILMAENDEDATQWCWILSTALRASYGWKDMNNQEHKKDVANEREVEYFYRPGSCKLMSSLLFYRSLSRHGPLHVPKYKLIYQKAPKNRLAYDILIFWYPQWFRKSHLHFNLNLKKVCLYLHRCKMYENKYRLDLSCYRY